MAICVDWIRLAQNRNLMWSFLNSVMNFRVPRNMKISNSAEYLLISERLRSVESFSNGGYTRSVTESTFFMSRQPSWGTRLLILEVLDHIQTSHIR